MPEKRINDPDYWRGRADELRAVADDFKDLHAREQLFRCADDYDTMARRAEERNAEIVNRQ